MRALFVEFIASDRFHRGIALPFLRGFLRDMDVPCRWIRFGLDANVRAMRGESGASLDAGDLKALGAALAPPPTHVLFNPRPSQELVAFVGQRVPGVSLGCLDESQEPPAHPLHAISPDAAALASFLGLAVESPPGHLFESVVPHFDWEPANLQAEQAPSLPFLICGEECNYRRRLDDNPYFVGVDLRGCERVHGCAFCARPAHGTPWAHDPVDLFERQLHAIRDSHRPWQGRLAVRAVGEPVLRNLERIAGVLRGMQIAPIDLLIDGRADTIVRNSQLVRRSLQHLRGSGHAIHLALIGIESFCSDELLRMNKGTTWQDSLAVVQLLFELEHEFPSEFAFRSHGGLSLLLFTPWTALHQLALNIAVIRRARLMSVCGKVFTSRLRLYPSLGFHALARRDGLLVDRYEDPRLDTAKYNFYPDETPWRFSDPRLEGVNRLFLRMFDEREGEIGLALADAQSEEEPVLALAEAAIDTALQEPEPLSPEQLLAGARTSLREQSCVSSAEDSRARQSVGLGTMTPLDWFELGVKPVVRLESVQGIDEKAMRSRYRAVMARVKPGSPPERELFIGREEEQVARAIAATNRLERARDEREWKTAAREAGVLLGYPPCCVEAFTSLPAAFRVKYVWVDVLRRLESPGEVPPLLNPATEHIVYSPCSLTCQESVRLAAWSFEVTRKADPRAADDFLQSCRHPWLMLLDRERTAIELRTDEEPTGRFRYEAGGSRGQHPLLTRVGQGDEMEIGEQEILVYRRGRVHASLGARAFVWWYRAALQAEFLRALVDLRLGPRRIDVPESEGPVDQVARSVALTISRALEVIARKLPSFNGYVVASVEPTGKDNARILLTRGDRSIEIYAAPRSRQSRAYVFAGPLALFHGPDEPLDSWEKDRAVRMMAAALAAVLKTV
jgi:hypothetical protein